ncbi:MAG: HEPN domain-containing protein [Prolixibacteraceae bacterium]|jgi:HEPN domain-containing protein|nr:HEPN domain-containing protein [Prolixibacteraceae bacterium]
MDNEFDKERIINHWIESSDNDFKAMVDLYQTKNNNWALFMGHLVIEKLLKALYVKSKGEFPPMVHDLRRICEKAEIDIDLSQQILLDSISRFNINARYDDYKQSFYQLCTDSFTAEWIEKIKECRLWIKTKL